MVIVSVLGLGRLGGNIAGDLVSKQHMKNYCLNSKKFQFQAFHGHTVRGWDKHQETLDKVYERLSYEKKKLKEDGLMTRPDFIVSQNTFFKL